MKTTRSAQEPSLFRSSRHFVTSVVTLALWRWRQHWFLLLVTSLGMVAAVMIVCVVPLLTEIMQTAEVHDVLSSSPYQTEMTLRATTLALSTHAVDGAYQSVNPLFQQDIGRYLQDSPRLDLETPELNFLSPAQLAYSAPTRLYGTSITEARPHVTLLQGRLPRTLSAGVEIAITPETAASWHVGIGSIMSMGLSFYTTPSRGAVADLTRQIVSQKLNIYVVGLFHIKPADAYWHGDDFLPQVPDKGGPSHFMALVSNQGLLAAFDHIAASRGMNEVYLSTVAVSYMFWYYYLDPARVSINQLDDLISRLDATQTDVAANFGSIATPY